MAGLRVTVVMVVIAVVAVERGASAQAVEKGSVGVGIIIGEPTGIAAKLYLDDDNAIQAAVGGAFIGGGLQVHADYLWHPWILEERDSFTMPLYLGPGARFIYYDKAAGGQDFVGVGARAVGGVLFDFKEIPLDVFIEVAGVLEWQFGEDDTDQGLALAINAGAGARYYF